MAGRPKRVAPKDREDAFARVAMEWGFKAHEKGMNLQQAKFEFEKVLRDN